MKLAVFGGAFNPIHNGHIKLIAEFQRLYNFDKILLIPTNISPHKKNQSKVTNQDRLNMCRLATKELDFVEVSDVEIKRGGVSYTFDTLLEVSKMYNNLELFLIVGCDMIKIFNTWFSYEKILDIATVLTASRVVEKQDLKQIIKNQGLDINKFKFLDFEPIEISSTQIRNNINNYFDVLNPKVANYIKENNLYV